MNAICNVFTYIFYLQFFPITDIKFPCSNLPFGFLMAVFADPKGFEHTRAAILILKILRFSVKSDRLNPYENRQSKKDNNERCYERSPLSRIPCDCRCWKSI